MDKQVNYASEILKIVRGNALPRKMAEELENFHENDLAEAFELLTSKERVKLCRILDVQLLSDIFEYLDEEKAALYLQEIDLFRAALILSSMETDFVIDVLHLISKDKRNVLLELMDEESKQNINVLQAFDEDEIGSHLTTNYIAIRNSMTIKEAMSELVKQADKNDNISNIFVVSEDQKFYGAIDLPDLIRARQDTPLEEHIVTSYPYVYGEELIEDCIEKLKDYSEASIPVLDLQNHLLGVITSQEIVELVDDEMSEDYVKLAGLTSEEDLNETLVESMKKRLPWLLVLLFLGMIVSSVVGIFEGVVSQLTLIMAFQSLILDMAGNVGTQSLAITIRVLMDETLSFKQKFKFVCKEMRVGFANGVVLGILSFIFVGLYIALFKQKSFFVAYAISGCIGISLLTAMLVSSLVGACVPIFFKKINIDPAVASGPLITTINDLVAVVCYYGLSGLLLINMLHLAG